MFMELNFLLIDDHPPVTSGYQQVLTLNLPEHNFQFQTAQNCQTAFEIITNPENRNAFDAVYLDYSLPAFPAQKLMNGTDLGLLVKQWMPKTKIFFVTGHTSSMLIFKIYQDLQPDGILIKTDFAGNELATAFQEAQLGKPFYTATAMACIAEPLFEKGLLDDVDREILKLMALGYKIESIASKVCLSADAIKKRKRKIKDLLLLDNCGDELLLQTCRERNLLPSY